jgi:aspartyl-tRNA(Asn)/glutamyl-tRNA(Gln) amidotransferase subunit C
MPGSAITRAEVQHLAGLARISLDEHELDLLADELPAILEHVRVVESAAGDVLPMSHPLPISNVFRTDVARPGLPTDDALAGAPARSQDRFLVPKILEEE